MGVVVIAVVLAVVYPAFGVSLLLVVGADAAVQRWRSRVTVTR